ncbi:hypothetical protein CRG98_001318 [Punica granatum]|uniref:Uncharacterized protein n=1 Tax=Punica granatum TaxID=22663 RepID=A0A2I0LC42_PUNGR|nr:hypothetical protein CRG98_001318 [Punica granatum]
MAKFIGSVKEQALKYAQIGKPKSPTEINRRIYAGLSPDWEPIVLAQSERMLMMSTDELQSLLVGMRRDASMRRLKIRRYPHPLLSREFSARLQKSTIPVAESTKEVAETEARRETAKEGKERAKEVAHTVGGTSLVKGRTGKATFTLIRGRVDRVKLSGRMGKNFNASDRLFIPDRVKYTSVRLATRAFLLGPFQTGPILEFAAQFLFITPPLAYPSILGPDLWFSVRCVIGPDLHTRRELMCGPVKDGLHCFHPRGRHSNGPQAHLSTSRSIVL